MSRPAEPELTVACSHCGRHFPSRLLEYVVIKTHRPGLPPPNPLQRLCVECHMALETKQQPIFESERPTR